ncbi:MAG TPA: phosphatase PAP2 family protein [Candidatus Eremiobacteraceae bacterium]|jgi:undecaprenyl-diphosphatase
MAIERYVHSLWPNQSLDAIAAGAAQYGLYLCLALFCVAWLRSRPRGAVIPFVVCAALAAGLVYVSGLAHDEPRPFVVLGVRPLVPHGTDNAFPSDHSAAAAYAATLAVFVDPPVGAATWLVTVALGAGRVYCLLHTPLDVVAGWVIGTGPGLIAVIWWRRNRR